MSPIASPKPCATPGCTALVRGAPRCPAHTKAQAQATEQRRGSRHERGYTNEWARYAKRYLREHPLCRMCEQAGRTVLATCVDHIVSARVAPERFMIPTNHQPLCASCHAVKTNAEDGGGWQNG